MRPTVTVVIPALNEEERIGGLLQMLAEQTCPPDAVIVADAGSTDATREIAEKAGALVVEGGKPAVGRNAGAAAATTELIVFFDADNEPDPDWLECAIDEFIERELAVAAGQVEPLERDAANVLACEVVNLYLLLMQHIAPHAPGFCIVIRRELHERIGGFDTTVVLAEDHEYVQRAAELGKFRVLRSAPMRTSMRRIEKEGLVTLAFKYLYSELYVVTGRPITEIPFEYEFAAFDRERQRPIEAGLEAFRERLEAVGDPLAELTTQGAERLRRLGETEMGIDAIEQRLRELTPDEIHELRAYVERRVDVARRMPPIVLRRVRRRGERLWRRLTDVGTDAG